MSETKLELENKMQQCLNVSKEHPLVLELMNELQKIKKELLIEKKEKTNILKSWQLATESIRTTENELKKQKINNENQFHELTIVSDRMSQKLDWNLQKLKELKLENENMKEMNKNLENENKSLKIEIINLKTKTEYNNAIESIKTHVLIDNSNNQQIWNENMLHFTIQQMEQTIHSLKIDKLRLSQKLQYYIQKQMMQQQQTNVFETQKFSDSDISSVSMISADKINQTPRKSNYNSKQKHKLTQKKSLKKKEKNKTLNDEIESLQKEMKKYKTQQSLKLTNNGTFLPPLTSLHSPRIFKNNDSYNNLQPTMTMQPQYNPSFLNNHSAYLQQNPQTNNHNKVNNTIDNYYSLFWDNNNNNNNNNNNDPWMTQQQLEFYDNSPSINQTQAHGSQTHRTVSQKKKQEKSNPKLKTPKIINRSKPKSVSAKNKPKWR